MNLVKMNTFNGMMLPLSQITLNKNPGATLSAKKQRIQPLGTTNLNVQAPANPISIAKRTPTLLVATKKASSPKQRLLKLQLQSSENTAPTNTMSPRVHHKSPALPISVARRNARERNRVKQVNNGFAALRERIPDEVAEVFEAHGNGRGSVKKLSKVETLRMAVEYIRSLEQCLADDGYVPHQQTTTPMTYMSADDIDADFNRSGGASILNTTTPPPDSEFGDDTLHMDDADLSDISYLDTSGANACGDATTSHHQQEFIRLPHGGTFQISTPMFDATAAARGALLSSRPFQLIDPSTGFIHVAHPQQLSGAQHQQLAMMSPAASLSPITAYDEHSMHDIKTEEPCYVIVTPQQQRDLDAAGLTTTVLYTSSMGCGDLDGHHQQDVYDGVMAMKTELLDDDDDDDLCDEDDSRDRLMSEKEHADSVIGSSLEWWQKSDGQTWTKQTV